MRDRALKLLQTFRGELPDLPPASRMSDATCRAYANASLCCLAGEYSNAIAIIVNARNSVQS